MPSWFPISYGNHQKEPGHSPKELNQSGKIRLNSHHGNLDRRDKEAPWSLPTTSKDDQEHKDKEASSSSSTTSTSTLEPLWTDSSTTQHTRTCVIRPPRRYQ